MWFCVADGSKFGIIVSYLMLRYSNVTDSRDRGVREGISMVGTLVIMCRHEL